MGCGKIREVYDIKIEKQDNEGEDIGVDNFLAEAPLNNIKPGNFPDLPLFVSTQVIKIDRNCEEVGKEGEDFEAGVLNEGKKLEESIDVKLKRHNIPKKLPPIVNPPIPSTILPKFSKFEQISHKPNTMLIQDLLYEDHKANYFEEMPEISSENNPDKVIEKAMKELFK